MIQANPDDLDPTAWTGNQRVLHFGPMANRDPFFYYYPKGWDILYPAQFGFFPYRTRWAPPAVLSPSAASSGATRPRCASGPSARSCCWAEP